MRALALTCAVVALAAAPCRGEGEGAFAWDREGYAEIPAAAREAKERGTRVLLGLSGGRH